MKKSYIALTVLAMAALVSCQENELINDKPLEKDVVGFYLRGASATKAGGVSAVERGVVIPLGDDGMGHSFVLEQTITNLDVIGPETKGTPAYTENVMGLYGSQFKAAVVGTTQTDFDGDFVYDEGYKKYLHRYDFDLWASTNVPVNFYMWMPGDFGASKAAINGGNAFAASNFSNGSIVFDYDGSALLAASADSVLAKDMLDLLFTTKSFSGKGTGEGQYNPNGSDILFHHAFTGVKFASGNVAADDSKIKIKEIIFRGLQDKGTCTLTGQDEGGSDDPDVYSSAVAAQWQAAASPVSGTSYSTGPFGDAFADYSKSTYKFPDSFTANGKDTEGNAVSTGARNLNDDNASQTLWIMPQTISSGVKLTIYYTVDRDLDGTYDEPGVWTIDFGEYLSKSNTSIELKAGQLHTFYIKIDDVNVMIEDVLSKTSTTAPETYDTKSDIEIKNTGSVASYIRASIIGQWLDSDENPVFGFTDYVSHFEVVDSWYNDQFGTGNGSHGVFTDLPGYSKNGKSGDNPNSTGWILCSDGFYYYPDVVEVDGTTGALFESYVVSDTFDKTVEVGSKTFPIHFQLEISTQAISAKKLAKKTGESDYYTFAEAWQRAIGYVPAK